MPLEKKGSPPVLMLVLLIFISFLSSLQLFCTPVMLPLIGKDLNLNTAQLGLIWGMSTFGGLFLSLPGGLLGDRIGPRWSIFIIAVIAAISLGLRGFAKDTALMAATMFIGGGVIGSLAPLSTKAIFTWFPSSRVGLVNGIWSGFYRFGMAVGTAVSITVVAALNSWQNTFFLYAFILFVFALLWLIFIHEPRNLKSSAGAPFREAFAKSIKYRDVWLCVAAGFGIGGLTVGFIGYLPTYLQNIGWSEVTSSLALTVYFLTGVVGGLILLALSDKARLRKIFFITSASIWIIVIGFFTVAKATMQLWILIVIAGFTFGGLAVILALIIAEIKGIGTRYAGTANSINSGIMGGAGLVFAAVGGKLALSSAVLPFIFGPLLCFVCIIPFFFTRETGTRNSGISQSNQ